MRRFARVIVRLIMATLLPVFALGWSGAALAAGRSADLDLSIAEPVGGAQVLNGDVRDIAFTLTNSSSESVGPVGVDIDIVGGEIDEPVAENIRWRERSGRWEGRLRRLEAGETLTVSLTISFLPVRTGTTTSTAGGGLVIAASVRSDDETFGPMLADDWVMANCGALFHASLEDITQTQHAALDAAVDSAQEGWRALRSRWVFDPGRIRGDDGFRRVVRAAGRLVSARGVDRGLRALLRERAMSRLLASLDAYVGQRQTPAICTGAPQYMDFLSAGLDGLRERTQDTVEMFDEAGQQADWKLLDADAVLAAVALPADVEDTAALNTSLEALRAILRDGRALWLAIADADAATGLLLDRVTALKALSGRLGDLSIRRRSPLAEARAAVHKALAAVEAFAYIQNANAHHLSVTGGLDATMEAVREAHGRQCTCSP